MNIAPSTLRLYAITDRSRLGSLSLYEQCAAALEGGITCLQLRAKELSTTDLLYEARRLAKLCAEHGVPLIINDNAEVTAASGADGVHIGQGDISVSEARSIIGAHKILGVSAHTLDEARKAEQDGADYLGVGAVFSTQTKHDTRPLAMAELRAICAHATIPVCAIGGICADNLYELQGTGIAGVAVASALFAHETITENCAALLQKMQEIAL